jgi:NAD+ kinase
MKRIVLIYKRGRSDAASLARRMKQWMEGLGLDVMCQQNSAIPDFQAEIDEPELPADTDAVVVLGGDGTFLSVARAVRDRPIPVVGVNLGGLGFLTEIAHESCFSELGEILEGRYEIEERMRLQISLWREGREVFSQTVLNDAVVNKGALARIVNFHTSIDGRYLTHYRADGIIVATPTGSTAYNLSAGGPIVYPTARDVIVTPICSFTLTTRPIILPGSARIELALDDKAQDVALTCDGQIGRKLLPQDRILITAAPAPLRLIKSPSMDYFDILRTKLKWGTN